MSADTREIVRATAPLVGWIQGDRRAGYWHTDRIEREVEAPAPRRRARLPRGVEGHRVVNGRWTRREGTR